MLSHLYRLLIPDNLKKDTLVYSHAKNIAASLLIIIVAVPFYASVYNYLNFKEGAYAILIEGIFLISVIGLFKYIKSLLIVRELIVCSITILLVWLTYELGGINSQSTYWLVVPALLSVFYGGLLSGIFW